jgi:hypothetical protein
MEDSAMAELAYEDLFVVRGLDLSFEETALLCDALNGVTLPLAQSTRGVGLKSNGHRIAVTNGR